MPAPQRSYLAFDLEIAKGFPDGVQDWRTYRPFGISCAATSAAGGETRVWFGHDASGKPADQMNRAEVVELVEYLQAEVASGKTILTWNGAGFDFDVLAEESGLDRLCKDMAFNHVDMMFHFLCEKGYLLGLDKAAKGMGLSGKKAGMDGALAPKYWQVGRRQEVLEYVAQDALTTLEVGQVTEQRGMLSWVSSAGKNQQMPLRKGWLSVREALDLPLPDTSWMKQPTRRNRFVGWITNSRPARQAVYWRKYLAPIHP